MKRYELKYTKGEEGVFRMSLVENPAVKSTLVMFDDEKELLQFADEEKRVVYSVAMRPNMWIPRKDIKGEPALVMYSEETAEDLLQNFFKNSNHIGSTTNHNGIVDKDTYFFEAWKVLDPNKDKGSVMGLDVKKGDIVLGQKIDNGDVWQDVKAGKIQGFSFEAYLEPVLIKQEIKMTKEEVDARIKAVMMESEEEKAAADAKLAEEEKKKLEMQDPVPDPTPDPTPDLQKIIDEKDVEINDLKAQIAKLEEVKTEMSAEVVAAKKVAVQMGEEIAKGIKPNPSGAPAKTLAEMSNYERMQFNKNKR